MALRGWASLIPTWAWPAAAFIAGMTALISGVLALADLGRHLGDAIWDAFIAFVAISVCVACIHQWVGRLETDDKDQDQDRP